MTLIPIQKKQTGVSTYLVMVISFIVASMLNVYPLSGSLALLRPMWLTMVLIFWLRFRPTFVGVGVAFLVGIISDLLIDTRLGQQAFCAVLVAFLIKFVSGYLKKLSTTSVWLLASACLVLYQLVLVILHLVTTGVFVPELFISLGMSILAFPFLLVMLSRFTH